MEELKQIGLCDYFWPWNSPYPPNANANNCNYCGRAGHRAAYCWEKKPDRKVSRFKSQEEDVLEVAKSSHENICADWFAQRTFYGNPVKMLEDV